MFFQGFYLHVTVVMAVKKKKTSLFIAKMYDLIFDVIIQMRTIRKGNILAAVVLGKIALKSIVLIIENGPAIKSVSTWGHWTTLNINAQPC